MIQRICIYQNVPIILSLLNEVMEVSPCKTTFCFTNPFDDLLWKASTILKNIKPFNKKKIYISYIILFNIIIHSTTCHIGPFDPKPQTFLLNFLCHLPGGTSTKASQSTGSTCRQRDLGRTKTKRAWWIPLGQRAWVNLLPSAWTLLPGLLRFKRVKITNVMRKMVMTKSAASVRLTFL